MTNRQIPRSPRYPVPRNATLTELLGLLALLLSFALATPASAQSPFNLPGQSPKNGVAARAQGDLASLAAHANFDKVQPGQQLVVAVVLDVQAGYHAQSSRPIQDFLIPFRLHKLEVSAGTAYAPIYAEGHIENYPALVMPGDKGDLSVYTGRAIHYLPVQVTASALPGSTLTIRGEATYQICDDKNCFAPETKAWTFSIPVVAAGEAVAPANAELFADFDHAKATSQPAQPLSRAGGESAATNGSDDAVIADIVGEDSTRWSVGRALLMAMVAGLIFNIMPCVLPVLPIKAWGFYEVANHNRGKSFAFGLVFALGLVSVFAVLGILILPLKLITWGSMFANPWFVWPLVIVLALLAMGLWGAFTTSLPTGIYAFSPRHDTFGGNFALGALTAVLATPCTAPLLPAVLLWAAVQPAVVGVLSLVVVGVGMALPYLVLSLFPNLAKRFPRTGPWPELFKQMMGFLMLAAAAYFAGGRLLGSPAFWWLPVGVVCVACLFLVVRSAQLSQRALPVGIASAIAVAAVVGAVAASPLAELFSTHGPATGRRTFAAFDDAAFAADRAAGRPVLVKFTANWCITCQVIERTVFTEPDVWAALEAKDVAVYKVDLTNAGVPGESLLYALNPSGGIPLTAVWLPGREEPVVIGSLYTADQLLKLIGTIDASGTAPAPR